MNLYCTFNPYRQFLFNSYVTNMPRYSSSVDGTELFYRYYAPEGRPSALATELPLASKNLTLALLH